MYIRLTKEQILLYHDIVIAEHGGLEGIREPGYIDLIVEKPFMEFYGEEQYPGLFMKAAVYWHGISTSHCFADGNKRTATLTALSFLELNGYELQVEWEELFEIAILVATKKLSLHQLAEWIESNV